MACRFLQAKWYDLQAKMGPGSIHFAKAISAITQYGATKFDYDEVIIFIFFVKIIRYTRSNSILCDIILVRGTFFGFGLLWSKLSYSEPSYFSKE